MQAEEDNWTQIIDKYKDVDAPWKADIVGRAYGNRGNARSRQGKLEAALADYNEAIRIVPWSVDPVLNRYLCRALVVQQAVACRCPCCTICQIRSRSWVEARLLPDNN